MMLNSENMNTRATNRICHGLGQSIISFNQTQETRNIVVLSNNILIGNPKIAISFGKFSVKLKSSKHAFLIQPFYHP